jgi:predicted HAD superfamily Cof-like phosphohydrolase
MADTYFADVQEFHRVVCEIKTPTRPSVPKRERKALRVEIMREEWQELLDAIEANDLVEVADACADLIVTILGTADEYGIPFDRVWAEVHRSNMAKVGGPVRADGKRLKPPGWTPPDVAGVLART